MYFTYEKSKNKWVFGNTEATRKGTWVNSCFLASYGLQKCVLFVYLHECVWPASHKYMETTEAYEELAASADHICKHLFPDVAGQTGTRVLVERSLVRYGVERVLLFFSACSSGFGWVWTERPQEWPALEHLTEWRWSRKSSPDTTSSPAWGNSPGDKHHEYNELTAQDYILLVFLIHIGHIYVFM